MLRAHFSGELPGVGDYLRIDAEPPIRAEVFAHVDRRTVRALAFAPTPGLRRGAAVEAIGPPRIPVGERVLGRALNLFGEPIDEGPSLDEPPFWSAHRPPVPLRRRRAETTVLETGIKAIDLLAPKRGGGLMRMRLKVLLPTRVAVDEEVDAVVAPGQDGSFGLLPRHVDFVNALAPGLLSYRRDSEERFVGVDDGLLVKRGELVRVATPRASAGAEPPGAEPGSE